MYNDLFKVIRSSKYALTVGLIAISRPEWPRFRDKKFQNRGTIRVAQDEEMQLFRMPSNSSKLLLVY